MRNLLAALAAVALLAAAPAARATTILFAGGEDVSFLCAGSGTCVSNINGSTYRAGFARVSYGPGDFDTNDPPANRFAIPAFAAQTTLWVHFDACTVNGNCTTPATKPNFQAVRVIDDHGNPTLLVRGTGNNQQLKISSRTSGGAFTDLVTCSGAFDDAQITQLDLKIVYGASGSATLFKNSVQNCTYSGDVTNGDSATTLTQVEFGAWYNGTQFSSIIVADTDTRAMRLFTAYTAANGNAVNFAGTNVCSAIWEATSFNDANFGSSGSNSVLHECTIFNTIPAGYTPLALVMSARALVGATGPQNFDFLTRTGGTDYASSDYPATTSFSNIGPYIQQLNPATSGAWVIGDFTAAGFNVGLETKP